MRGYGGIYTPAPKLVVELLSFRDSEKFFGDSGHPFSGESETPEMSGYSEHHRQRQVNIPQKTKVSETPTFGDSELFYRKHYKDIQCDVQVQKCLL